MAKRWTHTWQTGAQGKTRELSPGEQTKALELAGRRFGAAAIAKAIGRSVPDVRGFLERREAKG